GASRRTRHASSSSWASSSRSSPEFRSGAPVRTSATCSRRSGRPASRPPASRRDPRRNDSRVTRRVDLLAVDEVPEGTMKMAVVDETEQVIVIHTGGEIRAFQGICTHEYFELDKGFLTGGGSRGANGQPAGTLTCALHLS